MKKSKRIISIVMIIFLLITGCGSNNTTKDDKKYKEEKLLTEQVDSDSNDSLEEDTDNREGTGDKEDTEEKEDTADIEGTTNKDKNVNKADDSSQSSPNSQGGTPADSSAGLTQETSDGSVQEPTEDPSTDPSTESVPESIPQTSTDSPSQQPTEETDWKSKASGNTMAYMSYYQEVLRLVNEIRAGVGAAPLTLDTTLCEAATMRAVEMEYSGVFDHTRPDGTSCFTALGEYGISYTAAGENIAAGYTTPKDVVEGWRNSEGHYKNMVSSNFGKLGVGLSRDGVGTYGTYWVQLFTD